MKVSVVYCTARLGGLDILERCMSEQSHQNLEVIVVDELRRGSNHTYPSFIKFIEPPPKKEGMFWNLSASLNAGVRASSGELIVLLQDYIWVPKDGIKKYVDKVLIEPKGVITGVGNQYKLPDFIDIPKGMYTIWDSWPGEPSGEESFIDPRAARPGFYLCTPVEWEANWGCFKKQVWLDVGGFDEDFDAGWGYDNVNFAERAQIAGYNLFLDTYNEVKCYSHINIFGEKEHRDKSPNNQKLWYKKYMDLERKQEPWKLNYV